MRLFFSLSHGIGTSFLFIHTVVISNNKEPLLRSSCGVERGALQTGTLRPIHQSDLDRAPQFCLEIHFQSFGWKEWGPQWDLRRLNVTRPVSSIVLAWFRRAGSEPYSRAWSRRGITGSKQVLLNSWASAAPQSSSCGVSSAWPAPLDEPELQGGGESRTELPQDGNWGAGGKNKTIQNSGWKNSGWAPETWRSDGGGLSAEKEFQFRAFPPENAACEDERLEFISTPSLFRWGNEPSEVKWPASNHAQCVEEKGRELASPDNTMLPLKCRIVFHFLFAFSLWFELSMSGLRASKTCRAHRRFSVHFLTEGLILCLRGKFTKPKRFRPTS